jgi:hypothetical protein
LRIGALHHNIRRGPTDDEENLKDAEKFARIVGSHLNLVLHGHTHNGKFDWLDLKDPIPILSTGSAAVKKEARPWEVPNQYQVIQLWPDKLFRCGWAYTPDRERWIGDNRVSDDGDTWYEEQKVTFKDVAATFPQGPKPRVSHRRRPVLKCAAFTGPQNFDEIHSEMIEEIIEELMEKNRNSGQATSILNVALDMEHTWTVIRNHFMQRNWMNGLNWQSLIIDGASNEVKVFCRDKCKHRQLIGAGMAETRINEIIDYCNANKDELLERKITFQCKAYKSEPFIHGFLLEDRRVFVSLCCLVNGELHNVPYLEFDLDNPNSDSEIAREYISVFQSWSGQLWKDARDVWPPSDQVTRVT